MGNMSMIHFFILAIPAGLAVGAFAYRRIMGGAQPLRLRFAEKGERFLARSDVPDPLRRDVAMMLDDAFPSSVSLMILVAVLAPLMLPLSRSRSASRYQAKTDANADVRGLYLELQSMHRRLAHANHPIMMPLLELEVSFLGTLIVLARSLSSRLVTPFDRENAIMSLEQGQRELAAIPVRFSLAGRG